MRTLLCLSVLMPVAIRAAEAPTLTLRQKLHAKILESAPPPPSPKPATDSQPAPAPATSPVVMKRVVVSESKLMLSVTAVIERQEQARRNETFSPLDGGKIASFGRVQLGGWWSMEEGWTFLRLNKAPSRRQEEATAARMKELQELTTISEKPTR